MSRVEVTSVAPPADQAQRSWSEWIAWIATEDHCEWANCYFSWVKTPLGVLVVGAVCSLLCGLFVAPQGYVLLAAIAAVLAVGMLWPLVAIRGVRCRLVFEARRGREGQPSTAKLVVTNRWPWPVWGLAVNDPLVPGEGETAIALARVEGWSTATFNCSLTPSQRGVYPNRTVLVGTGFPFGLYKASRPAECPRRLIVWPQTFWLPPLGATASRPHWQGGVTEGRAGTEGTRLGVRDHRVGDSLRDVHWAKTARYDRLIVSERESATVEDATVVVDVDPSNQAGSTSDPSLEWRLRIAASICESFASNHGAVDLWLGGSKLSTGRTAGDLERLLDGVARFDAGNSAASTAASLRGGSGVVITVEAGAESIVLRRAGVEALARSSGPKRASWIEVDTEDDVPGQVLRGWRLGRRRASRAV